MVKQAQNAFIATLSSSLSEGLEPGWHIKLMPYHPLEPSLFYLRHSEYDHTLEHNSYFKIHRHKNLCLRAFLLPCPHQEFLHICCVLLNCAVSSHALNLSYTPLSWPVMLQQEHAHGDTCSWPAYPFISLLGSIHRPLFSLSLSLGILEKCQINQSEDWCHNTFVFFPGS